MHSGKPRRICGNIVAINLSSGFWPEANLEDLGYCGRGELGVVVLAVRFPMESSNRGTSGLI